MSFLSVVGREYDYVVTSEGRRYHGEFFLYLFEDLAMGRVQIDQFQVVQESLDRLCVRIRSNSTDIRSVLRSIENLFAERLPEMGVRVEVVETMERSASGKNRLIVRSFEDG